MKINSSLIKVYIDVLHIGVLREAISCSSISVVKIGYLIRLLLLLLLKGSGKILCGGVEEAASMFGGL